MERNRNGTSPHILSTSATMLGVCVTLLSLSRLDDDQLPYWLIDKMVAIAALVFLSSALLSFFSMRRHERTALESAGFERRAEFFFVCGLILLGVGAITLAFVIQ
jgi:hypothetical protein